MSGDAPPAGLPAALVEVDGLWPTDRVYRDARGRSYGRLSRAWVESLEWATDGEVAAWRAALP